MKFYEIKPIKVGQITYTKKQETNFVIDLISRDEVVYFDNEYYPELMVSTKLYKLLNEESFTGFSFHQAEKDMSFSMQHEIDFPGKKVPKWVRTMPKRATEYTQYDMCITQDNKIIINEKLKDFLEKNARVKRCIFIDVTTEENEKIVVETENERPIFKQEKEKPLIGLLAIVIIVVVIGFLVFH